MTAATVVDDRPTPSLPAASATPSASDRLRGIAVTAIDRLAAAATAKVDEAADRLGDMAADAAKGGFGGAGGAGGAGGGMGVGGTALLRGGLAALQGKNPVWAAITGAVSAMSTRTKVLLGLLLILLAVLSPVLILVLAIVLLVVAIAGAASG